MSLRTEDFARKSSARRASRTAPIRLVVNADDYGYFNCVSKGILELARQRLITATAVMANSPNFVEQAKRLATCDTVDVGVHLNLTYGRPLTERMADRLAFNGREFPLKSRMAKAILAREITGADVEVEWREQIIRCRDAGLKVVFLNSHEHLHALPGLVGRAHGLAKEFGIAHVRVPRAEWSWPLTPAGLVRNLAIDMVRPFNRSQDSAESLRFIGLGQSGRISLDYLRRLLRSLSSDRAYELMCHPGYFDPQEITDPALLAYHAWEQEMVVLGSDELRQLYEDLNVRLVGYRDFATLV
jgi:predicted glycoside hydrolase/deacetylase ChbG (UPF0249 family)